MESLNNYSVILIVVTLIVASIRLIDAISLKWLKRPLWVHFYFKKKTLSSAQLYVLSTYFDFYNNLSPRKKVYFVHRLATFITSKHFVGRDGLIINDEKIIRIGATAIVLTFGMRKYKLPLMEHILIYPASFYSTISDEMFKGEFNPALRTLVLSWKDYVSGFVSTSDNINLGYHEFTHVIHLNCIQYKSKTSKLFLSSFNELQVLLHNEKIKKKLLESEYFRTYAFTNKFEFLAVIVESFIESPKEFNREFPKLYNKLKQMLNFKFIGY